MDGKVNICLQTSPEEYDQGAPEYLDEFDQDNDIERPTLIERLVDRVRMSKQRRKDQLHEIDIKYAIKYILRNTDNPRIIREISDDLGILIAKYKNISAFADEGEYKDALDCNIKQFEGVQASLIKSSKDLGELLLTMHQNGIDISTHDDDEEDER
jgi:hypothetical protein